MRRLLIVMLAGLTVACERGEAGLQDTSAAARAGDGSSQRQRIEFLAADSSPYPFSPAVRVGGFLFLSGQIGARMENGAMRLVPGGIEPETRQTMDNIKEILTQNGSSLDRVVKCTVMIADMADWPRINTIYATYFPGPKPARSALGANGLALGAKVEIECIAAV
jgi:reactive intermediate/imine deaminase